MFTANRVFELQYSRFSIALQLFILLLIVSLTYSLLSLVLWLSSCILLALSWFLFLKQPRLKRFEYLDQQEWSFEFYDSSLPIQCRKIEKIIDHQAYIVLYFSDPEHKNFIIWWDQLSLLQWKNLKLHAKLA
ncbi:hypothetical protein F892_03319 [Acinetobacter vivianii]|uniref:Toxin CptA n=1 Tax=Acinetobacter vivianii TaxID=1776742 RepID=N9NDM1_9GAMM|nr:hypothetical protein [Acinetobacter vivianii]ENX19159.1 hypothetical protein F892_03319 [Acinetobacter vivianii]GGI59877.1 hypothetical protein GCM10011446_13720 [Acinetobacter vivianii]